MPSLQMLYWRACQSVLQCRLDVRPFLEYRSRMRAQATQLNASVLSGGTRPHRARRQHSKRERPFLWFAPVILLLLAVTLYPTALVIWISFQKTRFYALEGFVGLANYGAVLFSPQFIQVSVNSLLYVLCSLAVDCRSGWPARCSCNRWAG